MWIEDVKDSPLVQEIIDIAGKSRLEAAAKQGRDEGQRLGLAMALVRHAEKHGIALPHSDEATLDLPMAKADRNTQLDMIEAMPEMTEFNAFVKRFGVAI